jgi:outer membrane immunogenic protein
VLGLESDLNYLDVGAQGTSSLSSDTHVESDGGFLSTTRVRAGFAADRILIFGTGGLAVGDMNANVFDNVGSTVTTDETGLQLGWAAGGGVEYAWSDSASVKLEYLHYDLGTEKVGGICCGGGVTQFFKIKNTGDLVRLGVNFHF